MTSKITKYQLLSFKPMFLRSSLDQPALGASDGANGEETAEEGWCEAMESEAEGFEEDEIIEPTAVHQDSPCN